MNWPIVKLGSLTSKVGSGATPRGGEAVYGQSGTPLIRSMNVHFDGFRRDGLVFIDGKEASLLSHVEVQNNDVLLNITGASIGRVTTAPAEMQGARVNQHVCILRPTDKLLPRFLSYFFSSPDQQALIGSNQVGGTRQAITKGMLLAWDVPVPSVAEQERIVGLLDEAGELRKLRTESNSLAAALLPALFNAMFGDPETNPRGWRTSTLGELCDLVNGAPFKPGDWDGSGLPIIRIQNLNDSAKPFNYTSKQLPKKFLVRPGDILLSWSGTPGTSFGCFRWSGPEGWLNQHIFNVHLHPGLDGEFFIQSVNARLDALIAQAHGGVGLQHVTKGVLNAVEILVPPLALQRYFADRVSALRALQAEQAASSQRLESLFQSFLHGAFAGEL